MYRKMRVYVDNVLNIAFVYLSLSLFFMQQGKSVGMRTNFGLKSEILFQLYFIITPFLKSFKFHTYDTYIS